MSAGGGDPTNPPRVLNARQDPRDRVPTPGELRSPAPPLGELARCVRAGSLSVELHGLDAATADIVDAQYEGFVEQASDDTNTVRHRCLLEVARSPARRWLHLSRGEGFVEDARCGARWDDEGFDLWSYGFAARFANDASSGRLLLCEGGDSEVAQAVENTLRFGIAALALASGGFLLHSAGVARGGRAYLFFGPSGAGKSTTASHAPADADLLGDDLVLVEPMGPAARSGDAWRACGVPFRGSFARGRNAATCAPIALACRIVQADENRLSDAPRIVRIGELLAQIPFLMDGPGPRARAAELVEAFVSQVSVRRLHLRRDGSYWSLLE